MAYLLLAVLFALFRKCVLAFLRDRGHRQEETQLKCQPVKILPQSRWLSWLTKDWNTLKDYKAGTRNLQLQKQHKSVGNTFRTHRTSQIFTISPENVKATIGGRSSEWGVESMRLRAFKPLLGRGTLTADGTLWAQSRRLCLSNVNWIHKFRDSDLSRYDKNIQMLMEIIPPNGTAVNMAWHFNRYMIDSATEYILGSSVGALLPGANGEEGRRFLKALLHGLEEAGQRNEAWQMTDIFARSAFKKSCRIINEVTDRYVQQALREAEKPDNERRAQTSLVAMWAAQTRDALEVRNQVLNVLLAAFDATAIALTNAVFHLARHPDCYRKLREEALNLNGEQLTGDNIRSMKYLRAVLDETLRVSPPASFNSRMALVDTTLPRGGGLNGQSQVFVPRGHVVSVSIYSVQRNTEIFGEDADKFRPERWETIKPGHWDYLPFSAGPRVCPGQKLAQVQSAYVLHCLARRFSRLENHDPTFEFVEQYKIATQSRNGAQVAWLLD